MMNIAPHEFVKRGIIPNDDVGKCQQVGYDLKATRVVDVETGYPISTLLKGHAYEIELCEVKMPEDCFGYIVGRSTYNRVGVLIRSSIIDPAYHGKIGVTAYCLGKNNVALTVGDRVAQMLVFRCNKSSTYNGQYQKERLSDSAGTKSYSA